MIQFADREALTAHLSLAGWVPFVNGAGEHGVHNAARGSTFLVWKPNPADGYGSDWQVLRLADAQVSKAFSRGRLTECAWADLSQDELNALHEQRALEEVHS